MENDKKTIDLLKFYMKENQTIQLTYGNNIKVKGTIVKIATFMKHEVVMKLDSGSQIKVYFEDIKENSIMPEEIAETVTTSSERKSIPQSVRMELWNNHFGEQYVGKCFVCKIEIQKDRFDAGHIIAHADGGSDTADNMRPICKTCNTSMGTMNLMEFKEKYH